MKNRYSKSNPILTVLIVNFNSGNRLDRCLACLEKQEFRNFETIVFDNNSIDDSLVKARVEERSLRLIRSDANIGFAAANNAAARDARGTWIALLNPDAYPDADWLEQLVAATRKYPDADAFGSLQLDAERPDRIDGAGDVCTAYGVTYRGGFGALRDVVESDAECFAPCAAAALYRRETFLDLKGFDERFFCYGEDVDFGFRLRNAGGRAIQVCRAVVRHEGSGVTGRRSEFTTYHGNRNRIWLYYKNMPLGLYIATAPFRFAADLALFGKSVFQGAAGAYIRALIDGYAGLSSLNEARREISVLRQNSGADIAGALCWSPIKTARRSIDLRPIEPQAKAHKVSQGRESVSE